MTITQIEYILAVNDFRHFHKAAKACHVTQPTLSMQIQKLEDELGVILFDRSKSPVLVTIDGERFVQQAKVAIREFKKIGEVLEQGKGELVGSLKISVIPTLSPYLIPLFLRNFQKQYPGISLIIEENKTEDILKLLEEDKIDAGLLVTPLFNNNIIERTLYYEEFSLFASKNSPYLKKEKVKDTDINSEGLWILNEGHCFRDQILNLCKLEKEKLQEQMQFQSGNLETLKNLVLNGEGHTLLPEMAIDLLPSSQKKLVRSFQRPIPYREVSLVCSRVYYKERFLNALEQSIIDNLPTKYNSPKRANGLVVDIY
jgi:LysR family transcriptional regulator, hydrogen peroxide-inducible genes activator